MNNLSKIFTICFIIGFSFTVPLLSEENKPIVSVIPFDYSEGVERDSSVTLTQLFETALIQSGAFVVVKQSEVEKILEAQEYSYMDFTDKNGAIQIGKLLAAKHIFLGHISKLGQRYIVNIQLIDIEKGKAVRAESADAISIEGFLGKIKAIANQFTGSADEKIGDTPKYSDKVRLYATIGDRFASQMKYDEAIKQYEKALKIDEFNIDVLRRIITVLRENILYKSLYRSHAVPDGLDVAMRNHYKVRFVPKKEIENAFEKIYSLKAIDPSYDNDVSLLLDEAHILKVDGRIKETIQILEQAYKLSPKNPDVLAELGLLRVLDSYLAKQKINGIDLIQQAINIRPANPLYHFYLGRSLDRDRSNPNAGAIREYRWAAKLAVAQDFWTKRIRMFANQSIQRLYYYLGSLEGGILTPRLDMPFAERLEHLEYLVENEVKFYSTTMTQRPDFYLATLYHATGRLMEADQVMRKLMEENKKQWHNRLPWLELFRKILKEGGHDNKMLSEIEEAIKKVKAR